MTSAETDYAKPLPNLKGLSKEFYDWCGQHELRFQRCGACNAWRHVPREMCPHCGSTIWTWEKAGGRGVVFTWTVATRAMHPAFENDVPHAPAIIEMDEGVRLVSEVVDCLPDHLEIGMRVEVVFDDVTPKVTLPKFRRVSIS